MSTNRRIAQISQETSKTTAVSSGRHYQGIIETVALTDAAAGSFTFTVNNDIVQSVSKIDLTVEQPASNGNSSRTVTLTGTSGTENITVGGVNYLATFTTNLTTSATNFVTSHATALLALGITVTSSGAVLTFVSATATFPTITVANVSGDLSATIGSVTAVSLTGLAYATIESYAKGYFNVRVTNIASTAFNGKVKIHYSIVHN